jgi:AcrR family transcriptional regulator
VANDFQRATMKSKVSVVANKASKKVTAKADALAAVASKATKKAEKLEHLAEHLDSIDVWTRDSSTSRRPRLTREDIAAAAIRIGDTEGLQALSMRRLAAELDVGTMSLYHYVRTKDELLTLVMDALMRELLIPEGTRTPKDWRVAITRIAQRSRETLERHAWILDITDDPPIGPNAMRHFDQTLEAVATFPGSIDDRLDLMLAVDEYVFGYCLHVRNNLADDEAKSETMLGYVAELFDRGDFPALTSMVDQLGINELWTRIHTQMRDPKRFERNLARLLNGFAERP